MRDHGQPHKQETDLPAPYIIDYEDTATGQANTIIHPNGLGALNGYRLKYDKAQPDEGIYLINTTDHTETKVTVVADNHPAKLIFTAPDTLTPSQTYHIEVRAHMRDSTELRTGRLNAPLTAT